MYKIRKFSFVFIFLNKNEKINLYNKKTKKTMRTIHYFLYLWLLVSSTQLMAQSPIWTLPNHYYDFITKQPLPTALSNPGAIVYNGNPHPTLSIDNYQGHYSNFGHNSYTNPVTGELLFFVIDGLVYDAQGYFIDAMYGEAPDGYFGGDHICVGNSEVVILPNPANCKQFYIFTSYTILVNDKITQVPYYSILDISIPNIHFNKPVSDPQHNPNGPFGALINFGANYTAQSLIYYPFSIANNNPNVIPKFVTGLGILWPLEGNNDIRYAITPSCAGSRYLFIKNSNGNVFRLKLSASGLQYLGHEFIPDICNQVYGSYFINGSYGLDSRSELEVVRLNNGNYRLAGTLHGVTSLPGQPTSLFTIDYDANANIIPSSLKYQTFHSDNSNKFLIFGIEISPNGQYVYFTHTSGPVNTNTLEYWDLNTNSITPIITTAQTFANDFRRSFIETDANGNLYLATSNRLAQFTNANNPVSGVFNNNFLGGLNYSVNNYGNFYPAMQTMNIYPLQDQIDRNSGICSSSGLDCACCRFYQGNDFKAFTATQSAVWTPTNNPINNGTGNIVYIIDSLIIPAGINITIRDMEFRFAADAKVIVRRGSGTAGGGRLTLERTTFTADTRCCEALWQGVEVWGYNTLSQSPLNLNNKQGLMRMIDNSVVEHAQRGVALVKITPQAGYDFTHTGGVIQSTNSFFKNNVVDVEFRNYLGYNNNTLVNNLSFFNNTEFITNQQMYANAVPNAHVFMSGVYNVYFRGCDFKNTVPQFYNTTDRGYGIRSFFSQFHVVPRCLTLNCSGIDQGSFENLWYGIRAFSAFNSFTFTADRNNFLQNYYGIEANSVDYLQITRNYFDIIATSPQNPQASFGVYLNTCTGYKVEENDLNTMNAYNSSRGIIVNNSVNNLPNPNLPPYPNISIYYNEVYKNRFTGQLISGQSQGNNAAIINNVTPQNDIGLRWLCNTFYGDVYQADLAVTSGAIDYHQGTALTNPGRNIFSHNTYDLHNDFALNQGVYPINYVHGPTFAETPLYYTPVLLTPTLVNTSGSCPTKIISGQNISFRSSLFAEINTLKPEIETKVNLIDGGNTQSVLSAINGNMSPGNLKNLLLSKSPYLSDTVLLAYIARNPPHGHLKEVLIANSKLSAQVMQAVNALNLPNGIKNQILAAQNANSSAREHLINEISALYAALGYNTYELNRSYLTDTTVVNGIDSVINILKDDNSSLSLELLCKAYVTKNDWVKAKEIRDLLYNTYGMYNFVKLFDVYAQLMQDLSTCIKINTDPTKRAIVEEVAYDPNDRINCTRAEALLEHALNNYFPAPIEELYPLGSGRSTFFSEENNNPLSNDVYLNIYPNPTKGILNIELGNAENTYMNVFVYDVFGKLIYQTQETNIKTQIDLSKLPQGLYAVKVETNNHSQTQRVVVVK